jgi:ceramide glucosyltransferase
MLAHAAGWQLSYRSPFAWMLRDLLLPVLWVASWTGNEFVWRGNVMHLADRRSSA